MSTKPRIILADDHTLIREGITCLLRDEFEIVATAADGGAVLDLVDRLAPDAVVLDLTMPVVPGLEVVRSLAPRFPNTRFVVLTMHVDRGYVRAAFAAGAHGYVVKGVDPEELSAALWSVLRGERVVSPDLGISPTAHDEPTTREGSGALTDRQREVLRRVAAGMPCKQIATELGIALKTVEFHKASISRQLGLRTTAQLTRWAVTHGLVQADVGEPDAAPPAGDSDAPPSDR